ncbi:putative aminoacyltransferase, E1 ubiquitin-activating enzyme [Rosa chinensis]|uniref:RBR-type E3 ubiquitin transferase n=1 Tax=Rosa chinensis TaxID=74649 RepID=A0A2P6PLK1_ROSCH|nr:probable E3 ubiquitin-protein ligase ARI10 [Rosa chinensis]PRQ22802.1 putative aminoacyltransferase, E1 ubiquitin-activating enzyme [Rosa chinensis]
MDDMHHESDDGYESAESGDEEAMNYDDDLLVDDKVDDFGQSRSPQENYIVLEEEEIAKLQDNYIAEVSTVLSISKFDACLLLPHFHWRVDELKDEWFANEDKVREKVGLLKKPIVEHNARANLRIPCGICFEEYNYDRCILSASCGHPFCRDCWAGYISTTICDGGPACLRLRCPESSCSAAVGPDLIQKVLLNSNREAEHGKYKTYLLRSYVEDQRKIKWCPAPDCNCAIQFDTLGGMVSYDVSCLCSHSYCWNCTEENHRPVDCETVGKWILKNKDDSQNAQWILVNSKPCPQCKRPIEKNQGCNHLTCSAPCGYQFCWLCLGPHKNYRGCYCNSYRPGSVDNNPGTSRYMNETARKRAKKYLERYIHHYERWENNGRSKGKAIEDFDKVKTEHIKQLGEIHVNTKEHDYDFIIEAWQQIIECRQVLRWTYAYGYYMPQDAYAKKHLFECLQGHAEFSLERLHNCAESELQQFLVLSPSAASETFKEFKTKLVGLTKVTGTYFKRLVTALEEGLPETSRYGAGAAYEETDWTCDQCTYINVGSAVICAACSEQNPQGYWSCDRCTIFNPVTTTRCWMCDDADADKGGE